MMFFPQRGAKMAFKPDSFNDSVRLGSWLNWCAFYPLMCLCLGQRGHAVPFPGWCALGHPYLSLFCCFPHSFTKALGKYLGTGLLPPLFGELDWKFCSNIEKCQNLFSMRWLVFFSVFVWKLLRLLIMWLEGCGKELGDSKYSST